jgi:N-acetylmuramoyl-L-alanine amidase-like protein
MRNFLLFSCSMLLGVMFFTSCMRGPSIKDESSIKPVILSEKEKAIAEKLSIDKDYLALLLAKPLYQFSEKDVDKYLSYLEVAEPDQAKRVVHLARKNIGQPYQIFLLGEFPYEIYDKDPLYCLEKSDCVTFVEHTYAMALAYDWPSFFAYLQRIRYRDGEIGMTTRNHDTLPDWIPENSKWLIRDITESLAGDKAKSMKVKTSRKKFYKKWNIGQDEKEETIETDYIPSDIVPDIVDELKGGDMVNVIRGYGKAQWCGHVGVITKSEDGTVNFLHSCSSGVREEPILEYLANQVARNKERVKNKKYQFFGFKFYRMRDDAVSRLQALDGPDAPIVTGPRGLLQSRFRYPGWVEPRIELTESDKAAADKFGLDYDYLSLLKGRPLHEFNEKEIGDYLAYIHEIEPDIHLRIRHLTRKNIGLPYSFFLLGEAPFEFYDNDPIYAIHKGDCVVFSEHMYAMALSKSWEQFIVMLQRIRYKDGEIGVLTRNHFTVAEWDQNNSWLLRDISEELAEEFAAPFVAKTRHNSLFKKRYGIEVDMQDLKIDTFYVPSDIIPDIAGKLQNGDFVNVIYGTGKSCWASHVGLITVSDDGTVNFLHSTRPRSKEQPILEYNAKMVKGNVEKAKKGKSLFRGFKFLRLRNDPLSELRKIDGTEAPVVKLPLGTLKGSGRRWTPNEKK